MPVAKKKRILLRTFGGSEMQKFRGLRLLTQMHLARRRGGKCVKKIAPADIVGFIHGLRVSLKEELRSAKPTFSPKTKLGHKSRGRNGGLANSTKSLSPTEGPRKSGKCELKHDVDGAGRQSGLQKEEPGNCVPGATFGRFVREKAYIRGPTALQLVGATHLLISSSSNRVSWGILPLRSAGD